MDVISQVILWAQGHCCSATRGAGRTQPCFTLLQKGEELLCYDFQLLLVVWGYVEQVKREFVGAEDLVWNLSIDLDRTELIHQGAIIEVINQLEEPSSGRSHSASNCRTCIIQECVTTCRRLHATPSPLPYVLISPTSTGLLHKSQF